MASRRKDLKVLCLDGGGVRGVSSLQALQYIFNRMGIDKKPWQYFDIIGGTSTGGIIAIMLGRLRMSIEECIDEYDNLAKKVFAHSTSLGKSKYDHKKFESIIKGVIVKQLRKDPNNADISDDDLANSPLFEEGGCPTVVFTIPVAAATTSSPIRLRSFRSYGNIRKDIPIWQAARATSAAPTYFDPMPIALYATKSLVDCMDAGFGFNNPGNVMLDEIKELVAHLDENYRAAEHIGFYLSLGTGFKELVDAESKTVFEKMTAAVQKPKVFINAMEASITSGEAAHRYLLTHLRSSPQRYWRFNVTGQAAQKELDDYKSINLIQVLTNQYMDADPVNCDACASRARETDQGLEAERELEVRLSNLRHQINPLDSPFFSLGNGSNHIGKSIDNKSPYWSRVTFEAIELYKKVFEHIPKPKSRMVDYFTYADYFSLLGLQRGYLHEVWDRLRLHGKHAPENYVLACICMLHLERFRPTVKPLNKAETECISKQTETTMLACFKEMVLCGCRPSCKMEYSFLVHNNWGDCKGVRDRNCKLSDGDKATRDALYSEWLSRRQLPQPIY